MGSSKLVNCPMAASRLRSLKPAAIRAQLDVRWGKAIALLSLPALGTECKAYRQRVYGESIRRTEYPAKSGLTDDGVHISIPETGVIPKGDLAVDHVVRHLP